MHLVITEPVAGYLIRSIYGGDIYIYICMCVCVCVCVCVRFVGVLLLAFIVDPFLLLQQSILRRAWLRHQKRGFPWTSLSISRQEENWHRHTPKINQHQQTALSGTRWVLKYVNTWRDHQTSKSDFSMSFRGYQTSENQKGLRSSQTVSFYCRPFQCLHVVPDTAFVTVGKCSSHGGSKSSTETKKGWESGLILVHRLIRGDECSTDGQGNVVRVRNAIRSQRQGIKDSLNRNSRKQRIAVIQGNSMS